MSANNINAAGYKMCNSDSCSDRRRLFHEIGKISFALTELNLYLDTHPYDRQSIETYRHYDMTKSALLEEYTEKYGPIDLDVTDADCKEWKWATQDWPWEGGYN